MSQHIIAMRYAQCLYDVALEKGNVEEVLLQFKRLQDLLSSTPELSKFFENPLLSREQKDSTLRALFENKLPSLVYTFLMFVNSKGRLDVMATILSAFEDIHIRTKGQVRANIFSALPLDAPMREEIVAALSKKHAKEILPTWHIRKELIGGIKSYVSGYCHDQSFTSQLKGFDVCPKI